MQIQCNHVNPKPFGGGTIYMTLFSTKNGKLLVHFSCSFTQKLGFVGLKMQTFKNGFQHANLTKKHEFVRIVMSCVL